MTYTLDQIKKLREGITPQFGDLEKCFLPPLPDLTFFHASPAIVDQLLEENERLKAELATFKDPYGNGWPKLIQELNAAKLRAQAAEDVAKAAWSGEVGIDPHEPVNEQVRLLIEKRILELREKK